VSDENPYWEIYGTYPGPSEEIYNWYKTNLQEWNVDDDHNIEN